METGSEIDVDISCKYEIYIDRAMHTYFYLYAV